MLNLSEHNRTVISADNRLKTIQRLETPRRYRWNRIIGVASVIMLVFAFLPWTQTIRGTGAVTTVTPEQRPQTIHSAIPGRIEKWYVREGDLVKKGDTILFISEIKEGYFDPELVANTKDQVEAKKLALTSYSQKVDALGYQVEALSNEQRLKREMAQNKVQQSRLKITSDSMDLVAARTQFRIAKTQFDRVAALEKEGLKSMVDVEEKRLKLQETEAKIVTQENKLLAARNEWINARIELNRLDAEYREKIAKAQSDRFTAMSSQFDTEATVAKLESDYANYKVRTGFYYITAPQDGHVNRALQSGVGETIKEGTPVVSIMPSRFDIAAETYVDPVDMPLIREGDKVRVWFDGWPTIVFSGWPGLSYGTFGGEIIAIENFISTNGKYRVLIAPEKADQPWPKQLRMGAGAQTIIMLDTVPIWFEIWRTLNGFPPNFYAKDEKPAK